MWIMGEKKETLWITRQQKTGMVENRRREQKMCRIQVQKTVPQVIGWKALRENISAILN